MYLIHLISIYKKKCYGLCRIYILREELAYQLSIISPYLES